MSEMRLYDPAGNRLYLNAEERADFLAVARKQPARDRTLCETLHFTGCRPSELLEITPARVDLSGGGHCNPIFEEAQGCDRGPEDCLQDSSGASGLP
jgi:integrase